jgi:putative SOS response-associated peptidase YedK
MCGRAYSTYTAEELYFRFLNKQPLKIEPLKPNFNMSPTHNVPTLRTNAGTREFDTMHWGQVKLQWPSHCIYMVTGRTE